MATFLFEKSIFGPIKSRRFGISLGINLLPINCKYCSYDCIYCECGWTLDTSPKNMVLPTRKDIYDNLKEKLTTMQANNEPLDVITFAGNGEPTLHPEFAEIIEDTVALRNEIFPHAKITVLTNSTMLYKPEVSEALEKVDNPMLKLDAGNAKMFGLINKNLSDRTFDEIVESIINFKGKKIIQTIFLHGVVDGQYIDNTSEEEVKDWISILHKISPANIMIYPIDRETPAAELKKVSREELEKIAELAVNDGFSINVFG